MIGPDGPAKAFEELGNKFSELLQSGPARDFEKNARALFASAMTRMDLVTREEFEVQRALLEASEARISALEARLAALEAAPRSSAD